MRQIERASIVRIVSDLIKADGIIDTREIETFDVIREKYGITKEDDVASESCTLAQSLNIIADFDEKTRHSLMNDFWKITMSDDFCAKEEALLLLALRLVLTIKIPNEVTVLSVESSVINFDYSQILYLESEYNDTANNQMKQSYRELCAEVRLSGFELVYLPKLSEHYSSIAQADLLRIAEFLYPKVSEERIYTIVKQIQNLSTVSFCCEQLATKLSIGELRVINPSFLVKIGESTVDNKRVSNLLLVEIVDSPLSTVRMLADLFAENYHNFQLNYIQETQERFVFTGYYKQIFDILMLRKGIRSSVVLDPTRERVYFPEADVVIEKIHRREKALYALFLMESASGGINFNQPQSSRQRDRYEKRMKAISHKYQLIYRMFGGEEDKAPNIEIPEIRLPMISLLKRQLSKLGDVLYHVEDYTIQRNIYGNYAINIPSSLCFCCGTEKNDVKLITEAGNWIKIAAL